MMKKSFAVLAMCGMMSCTVWAQEVTFTGEKCPLTMIRQDGEGTVEVKVESADFLGTIGEEYVAVRFKDEGEDTFAFAERKDAEVKVPSLDFTSLPSRPDLSSIEQGASGEAVKEIQEALMKKDLLDDADGKYGSGTAEAVRKYQEEEGLPVTGTVDYYTYFTLMGDVAEAVEAEYPPVYNAEDKFSAIYEHVEDTAVLELFTDPAWSFSYDPFEGKGELSMGVHVGTWTDESTQIDKLEMDVDLIMYVEKDEEGVVSLFPAFKVTSVGSYRPYVETISVKTGEEVVNLPVYDCDGKVDGTQMRETAIVPITEVIDGEGHLRIKGAGKEYEMDLDVGDAISNFVTEE